MKLTADERKLLLDLIDRKWYDLGSVRPSSNTRAPRHEQWEDCDSPSDCWCGRGIIVPPDAAWSALRDKVARDDDG